MAVKEWNITLTLEGPIMTQATAAGQPGIDSLMARTPDGAAWCLPGTLIKGKLREAWSELRHLSANSFAPPVEALLGEEAGNENVPGGVTPVRGCLHFSDFRCTSHKPPRKYTSEGIDGESGAAAEGGRNSGESSRELFRVRMDSERGSVDRGAYLVIEAPVPVGDKAVFEGTIRTGRGDLSVDLDKLLKKGLAWIPSFGAERSVGYGRLLEVKVKEVKGFGGSAQAGSSGNWLLLDPLAPFCVAKRRVASNLFEAEEIISGGVIKGCLAATWAQMQGKNPEIAEGFDTARAELSKFFWAIRFTHAFPVAEDGRRPVVPPQSFVKGGDGRFHDVADGRQPDLVAGSAPAFIVDWKEKDFTTVWGHFGWRSLKKDLRVRTAMDSDRRKGKDEALFALETIVPGDTLWAARVDLSRVPGGVRPKVEAQIWEILSHGLLGLGKTKAAARLARSGSVASRMESDTSPRNNQWIVTLQTPALLCGIEDLSEASGAADLKEAYRVIWEDISGGTMTMKEYFAQQSLAGGYYLHRRFGKTRYQPYLLTKAGSVFVLEAKEKETACAQKHIENWLETGLLLPSWVSQFAGKDESQRWRFCPYIPENGYGEIAVNLPVHEQKDLPGGGDAWV